MKRTRRVALLPVGRTGEHVCQDNHVVKSYVEHNVQYVEDLPLDGWVIIDVYEPCSSTTPWDYYGMCHQREYTRVLEAAGITCMRLETRRTNLAPMGTGPGGMVRFGDAMLPHTYKLAVKTEDEANATVAIAAHKAAIAKWLEGPIGDPSNPMPAACYN